MTTAATIVSDALQLMGEVKVNGSPDADDAAYGLGVLNDMLHGWRSKGVDIAHVTLAGSETVNILSEHDEALKVLLAVNPRMMTRYRWTPDAVVLEEATHAWAAIYGAYASPAPAPQDEGLRLMPLQRNRWSS